jgi:pimeloyl-ACP methyl ester carboxylesterase
VDTKRPVLWHEELGEPGEPGDGAPVLLLLHGLGATGEVWRGTAEVAIGGGWPGTVVLVDLPGHGRSAPLDRYTYEAHAAEVASALRDGIDGGHDGEGGHVGDRRGPVVVAGHSMGGFIGILLAAERFGLQVAAVVGVGIKVRWSDEELDGMRRRAEQPARLFGTREEAATRYLRSVGLDGIAGHEGALVGSGVAETPEGWRLAFDPAAFGVGRPDLDAALAASPAPVTLARGAGDHMVSADDLRAIGCPVRELDGLGHNAHVEDPAAVWALIASVTRAAGLPVGRARQGSGEG